MPTSAAQRAEGKGKNDLLFRRVPRPLQVHPETRRHSKMVKTEEDLEALYLF